MEIYFLDIKTLWQFWGKHGQIVDSYRTLPLWFHTVLLLSKTINVHAGFSVCFLFSMSSQSCDLRTKATESWAAVCSGNSAFAHTLDLGLSSYSKNTRFTSLRCLKTSLKGEKNSCTSGDSNPCLPLWRRLCYWSVWVAYSVYCLLFCLCFIIQTLRN